MAMSEEHGGGGEQGHEPVHNKILDPRHLSSNSIYT